MVPDGGRVTAPVKICAYQVQIRVTIELTINIY